MTYRELLSRLADISPEEYEHEAKILVETFTDKKIWSVSLDKDSELDSEELEEALKKREARVPLQYILGKWEFYRQTYYVDESCLIPRSDTEILVQLAIEMLPHGAHFSDLCTGSGCIAISVLSEREDTSAVLVDKFPQTLDMARKNAEHNRVTDRAEMILMDVLEEEGEFERRAFDAILSNPPYIRSEVVKTLSEEVRKEPHAALDGGGDGLTFYRAIITNYMKYLKEEGFMLLEIGYDQAEDIISICRTESLSCEIFKDYGGRDRVAKVSRTSRS